MEALKLEPQIFLKLSSSLDLFIANSFLIFIKSRVTNISQKKQRELSLSIKRARNLALI